MRKTNRLTPGHILFLGVLLLCAGFGYWLVSESEAEKARNFYVDYNWLLLQNNNEAAKELYDQMLARLAEGGDQLIEQVWQPLVLVQQDGYQKLINYSRLLAGDTDREATYEEVADLISRSPKAFQDDLKKYYLIELREIPNVRTGLLQKYGLLVEE